MILKNHEIHYLTQFETSFKINLCEDVDDPKDMVNFRMKGGTVMIRFAGFYTETRARRELLENEDYIFEPVLIDHNDYIAGTDFYRVGWIYEE